MLLFVPLLILRMLMTLHREPTHLRNGAHVSFRGRPEGGGGRGAAEHSSEARHSHHDPLPGVDGFTPHLSLWNEHWIGCEPVYLWGGGKAGSTTLATYLKHGFDGAVYDPESPFVDAGKEICWAENNNTESTKRWALDTAENCGMARGD